MSARRQPAPITVRKQPLGRACERNAEYLRMPPRVSARGSNAQNSQLWSPGGRPLAWHTFTHFAGVQYSVWDLRELAHSEIGALEHGWRLARAVLAPSPPLFIDSRPMYRITYPGHARLHARSQVLARHRGLMCWIIGHYPIVSPTGRGTRNRTAASAWCAGALVAVMQPLAGRNARSGAEPRPRERWAWSRGGGVSRRGRALVCREAVVAGATCNGDAPVAGAVVPGRCDRGAGAERVRGERASAACWAGAVVLRPAGGGPGGAGAGGGGGAAAPGGRHAGGVPAGRGR